MLRWRLTRGNESVADGISANDVVVARGAISRVIDVSLEIDGGFIVTYTADGVVVTTPTGSTGYALGPRRSGYAIRRLAISP